MNSSEIKPPSNKAPQLSGIRAEQARRHLRDFVRHSWAVLEPSAELEWNWHIPAIADHVEYQLLEWIAAQEADKRGEDRRAPVLQNLVINVPPGTAKSRIVSVCTTPWMWLRWPSWRALYFSGNPNVAIRDSVYARDLIESDWYQAWFRPDWILAADQNAKGHYRNTAGGFRRAISAGAKLTGDRGDSQFYDDPNDAALAGSSVHLDGINDWYDLAAGNRVNDLRCGTRTLIMQRLAEADLSGHGLISGLWAHLLIAMEHSVQRECECQSCRLFNVRGADEIGWADPRTFDGELLFEKRFPSGVLAGEKVRLGTIGYAGQYQQLPAPSTGAIFQSSWFDGRYKALPQMKAVYTTWDTALKAKEENDESACGTYGEGMDGILYVLRGWHGRLETPDLARKLISQAEDLKKLFGPLYRGDYVEDKVSGTTLVQYVRRSHPNLALIPFGVEIDKVARAQGITPICEARRVIFPDPVVYPSSALWSTDLIGQLLLFPRGKHDDQVDQFVHGVRKFIGMLGRRGKVKRGRGGGFA